jgi:hypothetical protein
VDPRGPPFGKYVGVYGTPGMVARA